MDRVGVEFTGNGVGAITAARGTAQAIGQVRTAARESSGPLRNMETDLGRVERGALAGAGALHGMGRAALYLGGTYLGAFGLGAAFRAASAELGIQIKLHAQVGAALRSTGGIAGETAKSIGAIAQAESRKTAVDSDQIKSAEAMLLRFTQVRDVAGQGNDIFGRATKTALDLSVALGRDLTDSAFTLGKALNDPAKGIALLRREGAAFTADEQKQIKTLVAHGNVLGAQKALLDALNKSYGGTAEAVGRVEPWNRLKNTLKTMSADVLRPLLPEFDQLATKADNWATHLEHDSGAQQKLKQDVQDSLGVVKSFASAAQGVSSALGGWKSTAELLIALRFGPKIYEWSGAITALIGSESAGALAGLAGAEYKSKGLLKSLLQLKNIGPIAVTVALEFIPKAKPSSDPNAASNNPVLKFFAGLPVVGGLFSQANKLSDALNKALGITGGSSGAGATGGGGVPSPTSGVTGGKSLATTAAVRAAVAPFMNIPYQWGGGHAYTPGPSFASGHGRSGIGLDCSGFARAALANLGVTVNGTADSLLNEAKTHPAVSELQPGDLIFYEGVHPNHVMVYLGGGRVIGETHTGASGPQIEPINYLTITGTGRYLPTAKGKASAGAAPPTSSDTTHQHLNALPVSIRQAISAAGVAAAQAALTPGKADDRAAVAQQKAALEAEIAWIRGKLATNIGSEKRITLEDLLSGALGDLGSLTGTKTPRGASIGVITSLRNTVANDLKGLPGTLDDVEQTAVSHLKGLRDKLKVGMSSKDLADTRVGIQNWGKTLKAEISKQAKIAADAANDAARLWQRGWQNDVNRVLRDFQENVVNKQLDSFDRETQAGLKRIQAKYGQTAEEKALAAFDATQAAADEARQRADIASQIADINDQIAALDNASGTLIDISTGTRTSFSSADVTKQRKDLLAQLQNLNDQARQLDVADQRAALQAAADLSRTAADQKASDEQDAYQRDRDAQRQALQDRLDDQATALSQDLEDWGIWIGKKQKAYSDFLQWLRDHGLSTAGIGDPAATTGGIDDGTGGGRDPLPRAIPGHAIPFARGGRIPGNFIGRDSVPILASPGERMLDRRVNALLEDMALNGGGGVKLVAGDVYLDGRKVGTHIARPVRAEQERIIGYTAPRG